MVTPDVRRRLAAGQSEPKTEEASVGKKKDAMGEVMRKLYPPGSGRKMFMGTSTRPVEKVVGGDPEVLEKERAELRAQAARDLTVIGAEERALREKAGWVRFYSIVFFPFSRFC